MAEQRLDEVAELMVKGEGVDGLIVSRVEYHLERALVAAWQSTMQGGTETLEQLAAAIQQRQRTMEALAGEKPASPVRQLIREMERVRQEAHASDGDPDGVRSRERLGTPALPSVTPEANRTQAPPQNPIQQRQQEQEQIQNQQRTPQPSQEQHKGGVSNPGNMQKPRPTITPTAPTPTVSPTATPSPAKKQQGSGSQQAPTVTPVEAEPEDPAPPGPSAEPPDEPGDSEQPGKNDDPPQSPPEEPPGGADGSPPGKQKP
jgi:hypothetical protein